MMYIHSINHGLYEGEKVAGVSDQTLKEALYHRGPRFLYVVPIVIQDHGDQEDINETLWRLGIQLEEPGYETIRC